MATLCVLLVHRLHAAPGSSETPGHPHHRARKVTKGYLWSQRHLWAVMAPVLEDSSTACSLSWHPVPAHSVCAPCPRHSGWKSNQRQGRKSSCFPWQHPQTLGAGAAARAPWARMVCRMCPGLLGEFQGCPQLVLPVQGHLGWPESLRVGSEQGWHRTAPPCFVNHQLISTG